MANVLPDKGEQSTVNDVVTASVAVAVNVTTRPSADVAAPVMLPGTVSTGAIVSCTVTVNDALAGLPAASWVEH